MKVRFISVTLIVVITLLLASVPAGAAPGDLDTSFGTAGVATHNLSGVEVQKVVLQEDGRIIVVGKRRYSHLGQPAKDYLFIRRYTAAGAHDTIFSTTLKQGIGYDAEVGVDGKLVVVGVAPNTVTSPLSGATMDTMSPIVWRFNANGSVDTTFGTGGHRYINTIAGTIESFFVRPHIEVFDSRIVIGYASRTPFVYPSTTSFRIARISPSGTIDFTRTLPFAYNDFETAFSMKIDALTGDIVAAGIKKTNWNAVLLRFTIDNAVVAGFGTNGESAITDCGTSPGGEARPSDMAILPDGKILVYRTQQASDSYLNISRMTADGGADGVCVQGYFPPVLYRSLHVQPDGKFFIFASAFYATVRYFPDGTFDTIMNNALAAGPAAVQPDQKLVGARSDGTSIILERRLLD